MAWHIVYLLIVVTNRISTVHLVMKKHTKCHTTRKYFFGIQQINHLCVSMWNGIFSKGGNIYNEIESSLASIEFLSSKNTHNLSNWNVFRLILFLTVYILHFNWLNSYRYWSTHNFLYRCSIVNDYYFCYFKMICACIRDRIIILIGL